MVSCIYITDPAIGAVVKDFKDGLKKKYVFDYYSIKFQPGSDPTVQAKSQYPQLVSIIPLSTTATPDENYRVRTTYFGSPQAESVFSGGASTIGESTVSPLDMSHFHPHMSTLPNIHKPEIPTLEVHTTPEELHNSNRRYSVVSVTSMTGKIFLPNEVIQKNQVTPKKFGCFQISNVSIIPMRRISDVKKTQLDARRHRRAYSKNTETVEILVPYRFPKAAKCLHWILVSIFRVKPIERSDSICGSNRESTQKPRVFYDYTDTSHPGTPIIQEFGDTAQPVVSDEPLSHPLSVTKTKSRHFRSGSDGSLDLERTTSISPDEDIVRHPLRKVSSINVASLYRKKDKKKNVTLLTPARYGETGEGSVSISSSGSRFNGLSRLLNRGRSMSFSWSRLTRPTKKSGLSSPVEPMGPILSKDTEMKELPSSKLKTTGIIDTDAGEGTSSDAGKAVILAPFSGELSPRPAIQYKKRILKRRLGTSVPKSAPIRKPKTQDQIERERQEERFSLSETEKCLYSLTLLFDGVKNEFEMEEEEEIRLTADDILQPLALTFTPTEETRPISQELGSAVKEQLQPQSKRKSIEPIKDDHEGFMEGTTVVNYISNWEEADNGEASRITVYSEPWDIEEQYREQMEFKEDILHI